MKRLLAVCAVTGLILAASAAAGAGTVYVDPGGNDATGDGSPGNPYQTIQKGVGSAGTGDAVQVAAGLYTENVVVNQSGSKALTICGAGSGSNTASNTVIQGVAANSDAIWVGYGGTAGDQRLTFRDLRVTGGQGAGNLGMGIEIGAGAWDINHITFENVAAVGNEGHGIGLNHTGPAADIALSQCTLANNAGAGLRIPDSLGSLQGLALSGCAVEDNGGIGMIVYDYNFNVADVTVTNTSFARNATNLHTGGDIILTGFNGQLTLSNVVITSENAESGIRISGAKDSNKVPLGNLTLSMTDVTVQGTQDQIETYPSAAMVISRYKDLVPADIAFDNVNLDADAPYGLFIGTILDSEMDLGGAVGFHGTFDYDIYLGRHGNSSSYALAIANVDAVGCGVTELSVWDYDDDPALGQITVPEPATMALMGLGGVLALIRRRK